jgi:5-methylcytosine-specific restriction endonuclease McrA
MWSKDYAECTSCKSTEYPYMCRGMCKRCYLKQYRDDPANRDRIRESKEAWYQRYHEDNLLKMAEYRNKQHYGGMRGRVLKRDKYKCVRCGSKLNLVIHHKDGTGRGKPINNNSLENLETLCRCCHAYTHNMLNRWSEKYNQCRWCKTTKRKHNAHGLCRKCYLKWSANKMR